MTAQEFIRRLRRHARRKKLAFVLTPGKGDHMKVRLGERFTVLPGQRGEIRKVTLYAICRDLAIDPAEL